MTTECYITIHSTDLIRECEARNQFAAFESYTYLFVGCRPVDDMPDGVKVIVARDYSPNFEHLPQFYDFTGWWVLARHGLIGADRVVFLQYDMHVIDPEIESQVNQLLANHPLVAFNAGYYGPNWMLRIPGFDAKYREGMAVLGIDPDDFPPFNEWPSTQGTAWRTDSFIDFISWFTPLFDVFADNVFAGHLAERTVKAWTVINDAPVYKPGLIRHEAADLHGTGALMAGNSTLYQQRAATFGKAP